MLPPKTASRLAWSIGISSIALMVAALALMYVDRGTALPGSAASAAWGFSNVLGIVVNIDGVTIALVLASKRPDNAFGTAYGVHALVAEPGSLPVGRLFAWLGGWTGLIPLMMLAFLFLLFPTG